MTDTTPPYPDRAEIEAVLDQGIEHFETGRYFESHEVMEQIWLKLDGLEKHFMGGMILMAGCLHKAHRQGNRRSARLIYSRALHHLAWISDTFYGIDVREFERLVWETIPRTGRLIKVPRITID